jgi:molybdopterin-guanine dinucleotide biosynthesis protein A
MIGAILVGGYSKRMGCDKTTMCIDGERLLLTLASEVRRVCRTCILVGRSDQFGMMRALQTGPFFVDARPDSGPLAGLCTALQFGDDVLLLACDLPFVRASLLERMSSTFRASPRQSALIPRHRTADGRTHWEPLCSVWGSDCLGPAQQALHLRRLALHRLAIDVRAEFLDLAPAETPTLRNVNTPEDAREVGALVLG